MWRRLLTLLDSLLLLLMFLLHLLRLLLMPLFHLLASRVISPLLRRPLMFLVLFLLQLLPLLFLALVHLFLFLLVFLVGPWISRVRRFVRPVHLWQIVRMNVVGPAVIVLRAVRVIFRPDRVCWPVWIVRSMSVRTTIWGRIVPASFFRRHYSAPAKRSGSLRCSNRRLAMVFGGSQFAIRTRRLYVLD